MRFYSLNFFRFILFLSNLGQVGEKVSLWVFRDLSQRLHRLISQPLAATFPVHLHWWCVHSLLLSEHVLTVIFADIGQRCNMEAIRNCHAFQLPGLQSTSRSWTSAWCYKLHPCRRQSIRPVHHTFTASGWSQLHRQRPVGGHLKSSFGWHICPDAATNPYVGWFGASCNFCSTAAAWIHFEFCSQYLSVALEESRWESGSVQKFPPFSGRSWWEELSSASSLGQYQARCE